MIRSTLPAASAVLVLFSAAHAQDTTTLQGEVKVADFSDPDNLPPVAPISVNISLKNEAPEGVAVPADLHGAWGGTAEVGDQKIAVLVGKSDDTVEAPDWLVIDLNGDGKLSDEEYLRIKTSVQDNRGMKIERSEPVEAALPKGATFEASFMRFGDRGSNAILRFPKYLEATGPAGIVAVVDKDLDGVFGSAGDLWTLAQKGDRPVSEYGLMTMDQHVFHDGHLYGIKVKGTDIELSSKAASGPVPAEQMAQRERVEHLWMDRFNADRESFVKAHELDTSRPLAEKPIAWHYVSYADAIKLGAEAKKPVFIDVMAFWCVWCYRMDWSTYPDAEVAKILNEEFVPVKVIQEQAKPGDYDMLMKDKLEARGIPAMGVFNEGGDVVYKISGWEKPEEFVDELKKAKAAYDGK